MSIKKELSVIISELQDAINMQEVEIANLTNERDNLKWENTNLRRQLQLDAKNITITAQKVY